MLLLFFEYHLSCSSLVFGLTPLPILLQWLSANMAVNTFATGALAWPVFRLGFVDSVLTIFFFTLLGLFPVAFFSSFGPRFGLRQMVISRFWFGYRVVKGCKCPAGDRSSHEGTLNLPIQLP